MVYYFGKSFKHEDLESKKIKDENFRVFSQEDFDDYVEEVDELSDGKKK